MKAEFIDLIGGDVRKSSPEKPKSMNTNISLTNADIVKNKLIVDFEYTVKYSPGESYVRISGKGVFSGNEVKKAKDEWQKTKTITGAHGELVINSINYTATLNALLLARAFDLTPPIVLPVLKFSKKS